MSSSTLHHAVRRFGTSAMGLQLLCVAVALLCASVVLLGLNIFELRQQVASGRDTDAMIEVLDETANHLLGIEVAVRGYALFGNPKLLERYRNENARLSTALDLLRRTKDRSDVDQAAFDRVRRSVAVRMAIVDSAMRVAPNPPINVGLALRRIKSAGTIDAARGAIAELRSREIRRRETLASATERKAFQNVAVAVIIVIISVFSGALGASFALFGSAPEPNPST